MDASVKFSTLSGDYNPIHINKEYARRLQFGRAIAHGIHAVMLSLELLFSELNNKFIIQKLNVRFQHPIYHDDIVFITVISENENGFELKLVSQQKKIARIQVTLGESDWDEGGLFLEGNTQKKEICEAPLWGDCIKISGNTQLYWNNTLATELFPSLVTTIPSSQSAFLLSLTRAVGMTCPGLHSIFSSLDMRFNNCLISDFDNVVSYEVENSDERFNLLEIGFDSVIAKGVVSAFYRSQFSNQSVFSDVISNVSPQQFCGCKILVIGGGRGLGESIAKVYSAGGAEVFITYNQGISDAQRVVKEITLKGKSCCAMPLNILQGDSLQWDHVFSHGPFDILLYFATPRIELNPWSSWRDDLFNQYCKYYINGFLMIAQRVENQLHKKSLLMQPSTVFVDEPEEGTMEYSAAKSAMESISRHIEKEHAHLSVLTPRLPRLITDQTCGVDSLLVSETLPVMIDLANKCYLQLLKTDS